MTSFADPAYGPPPGDLSQDVQVNLTADVSGYTEAVGQAQQATTALASSVGSLLGTLSGLGKFAGQQLFHISAASFAGLGVATADAAALEHQLGTLRATSRITGTSMSAMTDELSKAFDKFPVARREVVQLFDTITKVGVTTPSAVGKAADTYIKLGALSGEDRNMLAAGGLQLNRQMGNTNQDQIAGYANSLAVLSKNNGVAVQGITEFASAIAPMSRAAGIGQAAVQGIATAFQKAGADGAYAANTFNKIVTEISTLQKTGSPEIAKYANFVGQSAQQFRALPTGEAATRVFEQIGKGGPEALSFTTSLGLGPRDIRAVQAVAQSGGLRAPIAQSLGAVTNTRALDEGSKAAFDSLTSSVEETGAQFTKMGELIGGPLLKPLTALVDGFNKFLSVVNTIVKALGPLPAVIGSIVAVAAPVVGVAAGHLGTIGTLALGRSLLGRNSISRMGFTEGRQAGRAIAEGMPLTEALQAGEVGRMVDAGTAKLRASQPYNWGMALGRRDAAQAASGQPPRQGVLGVIREDIGKLWGGMLGAGTWLMNTQTQTNRDSTTPGPDRPANSGRGGFPGLVESIKTGSVRKTAGAAADLVTSTVSAGIDMAASVADAAVGKVGNQLGEKAKKIVGRGGQVFPATPPPPPEPPFEGGRKPGLFGTLASMAGGLFSGPGMLLTGIGIPLVSSIVDAIKEGEAQKKDIEGALSGASAYDQALDKTSENLANFGDSLNAAADRLAKFASTPIEQLTTVTGQNIADVMGGDYQVSDQKLVSLVDVAKKEAKRQGGDKQMVEKAVGAYLDAQALETGPITGDRFEKYKEDILSQLPGQENLVEDIMTAFASRQSSGQLTTPDFNLISGLAARAGDNQQFKDIFGVGVTGLQAGTQNAGDAGIKMRWAQALSSAGIGLGGPGGETTTPEFLFKQLGIDPEQLKTEQSKIAADRTRATPGMSTYTQGGVAAGPVEAPMGYGGAGGYSAAPEKPEQTADERTADIVKAALATEQGKAFKERFQLTDEQVLQLVKSPGTLPPLESSGTIRQLQAQGSLGRYAAAQPGFVSAAIGADAADPGKRYAASVKLTDEAIKDANGNLTVAVDSLYRLASSMGGMSSATGALITQAGDWAAKMQQYQMPTLSSEQQMITTSDIAKAAITRANAPGNTEEDQTRRGAAIDAFEASKENERQKMIGLYRTGRAFQVSQDRGAFDNQRTIDRSNRDFALQQQRTADDYATQRQHAIDDYGTQRVRAEQAYNLQVLHAQEDYQTQSLRANEDYQTGIARQTEDHLKDLKRQSEQAAREIYDPYVRTQVKAVTSAGILIYNLKEQNADIERQLREIGELRQKGVSQQTIDVLKLGETDQDQQVTALNRGLDLNPAYAQQINELVAKRQQAAKQLTQSDSNLGFREAEEDYRQAMERGSEDFNKAQTRVADDQEKTMQRMSESFGITTMQAAEDQAKSLDRMSEAYQKNADRAVQDHAQQLSDMAENYKLVQDRAAEDLATSIEEYNLSFEEVMKKLTDLVGGRLKEAAPQFTDTIIGMMDTIKAAIPGMLAGNYAPAAQHQERQERVTQVTPQQHVERQSRIIPAGSGGGGGGSRSFAFGGISMTSGPAWVSEHGPELHLPLNSKGEDFMAGLIAKSLARGITMATNRNGEVSSVSNSSDNSISFAGSAITVVAPDPNAMARELAAKAKLQRLASPVRH